MYSTSEELKTGLKITDHDRGVARHPIQAVSADLKTGRVTVDGTSGGTEFQSQIAVSSGVGA